MRSLPKKQNPLIAPDACPEYGDLLSRRRLGKTNLSVKPGQVGTSNATKPENLGMFEYAHLRAPLPKDLKGSEIFASHQLQPHPETYFLMRRSRDGYVSATGMFKIAFPWAKHAEEKGEREHLKSLESTSQDEVAGNVWITPELALELAEEYGMYTWVQALLDPKEIEQSPSKKKHISPPPKFEIPAAEHMPPPPAAPPARGRGRRSMSPSKIASPTKNNGSPRKPRQTKAMKEANAVNANAASASLQAALDTAASTADSESVVSDSDKVKVEVDSAVDLNGDVETTHTHVTVEMPKGSPELPLPEDTEKMIETAKKMVEEAKELEAESSSKSGKKRKVEDVDVDSDATLAIQPAKKARVLEEKLRREKVRTRALVGVAATLAVA
ncbi:MAG: hypothetical protein Q9160_002299 [Pyrenula sp. 1 TL-2023]